MTWYQTEHQQAIWRQIIEKPTFNLTEVLNCQQLNGQIKSGNLEIIAWIENHYLCFFQQLLERCLVLPNRADSDNRKFKEPMQSINMMCMLLDTGNPAIPALGLPSSSITSSVLLSGTSPNSLIRSPEILNYIINQTFALFQKNNPQQLVNTLVPGYFTRIFQSLHHNHCPHFSAALKNSHYQDLQNLLQNYGHLDQIIKCIQYILIVPIPNSPSAPACNITASISISQSITQANHSHPSNYSYQLKYRMLAFLIKRVKHLQQSQQQQKWVLLENIFVILIELLKKCSLIFQGNVLIQSLVKSSCAFTVIGIVVDGYVNGSKMEGVDFEECRFRACQLFKCLLKYISVVDRLNLYEKFDTLIDILIQTKKPTIMTSNLLQILAQWVHTEAKPATSQSILSFSSSLKSSASLMSTNLSPSLETSLTTHKFFQTMIRLCSNYPNYNILHQRVLNLISTVFKTRSQVIINSIFSNDKIIEETVTKVKDFKRDSDFGYFMMIIEIYTKMRIDTLVVNMEIEKYNGLWAEFYGNVLVPHFGKLEKKLGEMEISDALPLNHTVSVHVKEIMKENKSEIPKQSSITPQTKTGQTETQQEQQSSNPIAITFKNIEQDQNESKQQNQSFSSFMKRKMSEGTRVVEERRKSRTPPKLKSTESKRKKWNMQNEASDENARRSVSAEEKSKKGEEKVEPIIFIKLKKEKCPKFIKERAMNKKTDSRLMKWLEIARNGALR